MDLRGLFTVYLLGVTYLTFVVCDGGYLNCQETCGIYCDCCEYNHGILTQLTIKLSCETSTDGTIIKPDMMSEDAKFALSFSGTCLSAVPENICDFPGIQYLELKSSNIDNVPILSCLKDLVYLDLSFNKIRILKTGIFDGLEQLRILRLQNNDIERIEPGVFHTGLISIKHVYLTYNQLTETDLWVLNITHKFCQFDLSNNKISKCVNEVGFKINYSQNYGPGIVNLRHNNISEWPNTLMTELGFTNIRMLGILMPWGFDLRFNPWHCDCRMHSFMKFVANFIYVVPRNYLAVYCQSPPSLKGTLLTDVNLEAFVCNITELCPPNCFCQDQPQLSRFIVDCANANLNRMPKELPNKLNLFLYFQNNYIEQLADRPYLKSVIYLDVSNNNLSKISELAIDNLNGLTHLNLADNQLQTLPENIQKLRKTQIILLNNSLTCSCSNIWLFKWFGTKPNVKDKFLIKCLLGDNQEVFIVNLDIDKLECEIVVNYDIIIALGILTLILLIVLFLCLYYRFELLTLYYVHISPKLHSKSEVDPFSHDIFLSCYDDNDNDRIWVTHNLLPIFNQNNLTCYASFRDGIYGEIKVDANIKTIHNSRAVIAVISHPYVTDSSMMFELNEIYHHMIKNQNGQLIIIKRGEFLLSSINNGYIRSLFRLKCFIKYDDDDLFNKISSKFRTKQNDNHRHVPNIELNLEL